jgi:hypothetical protein
MNRRLFVARIHNANTFTHTPIINSRNVTPAQGEDNFNPFSFQHTSDKPTAVNHTHDEDLL